MKNAWILTALILLAGCGYGGPKDAEQALKDKGVLDVLEQAGEDDYDPPADGKLTEKQIQMYLDVKKRERDLAKVAAEELRKKGQDLKDAEKEGGGLSAALKGLSALKDLTNLVTADIRAAQELGYNTAEYSWVKSQVLEAGLATWSQNIREQSSSNLQQGLQQLKDAREKAQNDEMRQFYDEQIANYEQLMADQQAGEETSEAVEYNQTLIKKYGDELKLLEDEIQKYGLASSLSQDNQQ